MVIENWPLFLVINKIVNLCKTNLNIYHTITYTKQVRIPQVEISKFHKIVCCIRELIKFMSGVFRVGYSLTFPEVTLGH